MTKPLFSIIVTTFNNSKTIEKTIKSVINQTLNNDKYEIIVVDDKSTDDTLNKLNKYEVDNLRIYPLDTNSGGPSQPRNIGFNYSNGKYIHFLDGDDWLNLNILENISSKYYSLDSDVIIAKVIKYKDGNQSIHAKFMTINENINKESNDIPYLYYYLGPSGKFIKRDLILNNNIQFPHNLHFGEDKLFFMNVFSVANSVTTIPLICNYVNRSTDNISIVKKSDFVTKRESDLIIFENALNISDKNCKEKFLLRIAEYDLLNNCNSQVFLKLNTTQKTEVFNIIKRVFTHQYIKEYIVPLIDDKYKYVIEAVYNNDLNKFNEFFEWYKQGVKLLNKKNDNTYSQVSTCNHQFEIIVPFANTKNLQIDKKTVYLQIEVNNLKDNQIEGLQLESRSNFNHSKLLQDFSLYNGLLTLHIDEKILKTLNKGIYNILVIYDSYKALNIKYAYTKKIELDSKNTTFYPTINGNLSVKCQLIN